MCPPAPRLADGPAGLDNPAAIGFSGLRLRECYRSHILPARRTVDSCQLVDRDGLVGRVTVCVKALMTGDAIVIGLGYLVNHCLAECLRCRAITRAGGSLRASCNSGLDRREQDLHGIITARAIGTQRAIFGLVVRDESSSRWNFGRIDSGNGGIHWTASGRSNGRREGAVLETITASERSLLQASG